MPPSDLSRESTPPRQPYTSPRLVVYGTVHDLTLANLGGMGKNDMASGPAKTGF